MCEIIEENGSTKKVWKELREEKKLQISMRNREGRVETKRGKTIKIATEFYKQLYGGEREETRRKKKNRKLKDGKRRKH